MTNNILPLKPFDSRSVQALVDEYVLEKPEHFIGIIKAERLTPDSVAVVLILDKFYVLYSEDFIDSLDVVSANIERWFACIVRTFVPPKQQLVFEESIGAQYYTNIDPDKLAGWLPFAVEDDHNFAFLAEVEPTDTNDSFWCETKVEINDLPPETQARLQHYKKPQQSDPNKTFLENWQIKNASQDSTEPRL